MEKKSQDTLAEMFLKASSAESHVRIELLKRLGDTSLYISGIFGDSLQRKIVDLDYYAEMGGSAYASLADVIHEDTYARLYGEFGKHFLQYVDVLTYISQKANLYNSNSMLRTYERFVQTGSNLAKEELSKKGVVVVTGPDLKACKNQ